MAIGIAGTASALPVTIDFTEPEFPGNLVNASTEYAAYGVTFSNAYYYVDSRDPFADDQGISNGPVGGQGTQTGQIDFAQNTSYFSFDWWTIGTNRMIIEAYNSLGALVALVAFGGSSGSATIFGDIAMVKWHDNGGFVQFSTISFDGAVVPLPGAAVLMLSGLGLLGGLHLRRKAS
jgi:hypothetical protein